QVGMERIIHIHIRHRDEIGDLKLKTLIVELTGRHSNIILLDQDSATILEGIHHVTPALSSYRIVMPGSAYTPPPEQNKRNLLDIPDDQLDNVFSELALPDRLSPVDQSAVIERKLMDAFSGVGPLTAREIVNRAVNNGSLYEE